MSDEILDQLMDTLLYEAEDNKDKRATIASRLFTRAISDMEDTNLMIRLVEENIAVGNAIIARLNAAHGRA